MNIRQTPPLTCDKKECDKPPTKKVLLSLAVHATHPPAISTPIAYFCDEHCSSVSFEDFANAGSNWQTLCNNFTAIGRQAPKKEFSKLIIEPI